MQATADPTATGGVHLLRVKAYFDGSKQDERGYLTLASLVSDENTWTEIEAAWEGVRKERGNPPSIHMTDAMALRGAFKNWTKDDRDHLIDGLLNVLLFFRGRQIRSFTCSIDLAAYKRLTATRNLPSPERLCARMVFPHAINWYAELPGVEIGHFCAYFDRNEKFMRHIEQDWRSKEIRKRYPKWSLVKEIAQVDMDSSPRLQMTDVVAWGRNRLASGSTWDRDSHYIPAVRASGALQGIHRPIDQVGLANFSYREEGFAAIDTQRMRQAKDRVETSDEFKKFDQMMREMMRDKESKAVFSRKKRQR